MIVITSEIKMRKFTSYCIVATNYPPEIGGPAKFAATYPTTLSQSLSGSVVTTTPESSSILYLGQTQVIKISRANNIITRTLTLIWSIRRNSQSGGAILANGFFIETWAATLFSKRRYIAKIPGDIVWEKATNSGVTKSTITDFQTEKLNLPLRIFRSLNHLAVRNARTVICPTDELKEIMKKWGVSKERLRVIPNSVDSNDFQPNPSITKDFDVICVNRLVSWKGMSEVIEACAKLDLKLLIAGTGPLSDELKSLTKKLNSQVVFLEDVTQSELVNHLNRSRIYILNSTFEATAYSLLEAMSCGLAVIARFDTGSQDVIHHRVDGLLVGHTDFPTIDAALKFLIESPEQIENFGTKAREVVISNFDMYKNYKKISSLLFHE